MTYRRHGDEAGKGGPLFFATLWMAICVALLCALAPLGPPSSKLTGSAFNPATTGVVLKARSPAAPLVARMVRPDGEGAAPPVLPAPFLAPLTAAAPVLHLRVPRAPLLIPNGISPPPSSAIVRPPERRHPPDGPAHLFLKGDCAEPCDGDYRP